MLFDTVQALLGINSEEVIRRQNMTSGETCLLKLIIAKEPLEKQQRKKGTKQLPLEIMIINTMQQQRKVLLDNSK